MFASRWHSPPNRRRSELRHRHVQRGQPVGVERALHVALEHARADAAEVAQHALEQRRLARARRAHEVRDRHARAVEVVAVGARDRVVGVERVLDDPHPDRCIYIVRIFRYRLISGSLRARPRRPTASTSRRSR